MPTDFLAEAYRSMVTSRRAARLTSIVAIVADAPGSTLVHCAAGKDRTGVAVALLHGGDAETLARLRQHLRPS